MAEDNRKGSFDSDVGREYDEVVVRPEGQILTTRRVEAHGGTGLARMGRTADTEDDFSVADGLLLECGEGESVVSQSVPRGRRKRDLGTAGSEELVEHST